MGDTCQMGTRGYLAAKQYPTPDSIPFGGRLIQIARSAMIGVPRGTIMHKLFISNILY